MPDAQETARVRYERLTPEQRETLHAWFDAHGVNHRRVPVDPRMRLEGDVLHIEVYATRDGRKYVGDDGKVAKEWIRVTCQSPLPWPKADDDDVATEILAEVQAEGRGLCTLALACASVTPSETQSLLLDVGLNAGFTATLTVLHRRGLIVGSTGGA